MSLNFPEGFNQDFAKQNLWEAYLWDVKGRLNEKIWKGLIKSVSTPRITFEVNDILAGSNKAYSGWKLPDNIKLSIWETSDHQVEKYLNSWMTGEEGVFNVKKGCFRTGTVESLYRKLEVVTFKYRLNSKTSGRSITKAQVLPVFDKVTSFSDFLINNQVAKIPIPSDLKRAIMPPVVIPPILMKQPVEVNKDNTEVGFTKVTGAEEIVTSRIFYTTAIVGYTVDSYTYDKGDAVSYEVDLAVADIDVEDINVE